MKLNYITKLKLITLLGLLCPSLCAVTSDVLAQDLNNFCLISKHSPSAGQYRFNGYENIMRACEIAMTLPGIEIPQISLKESSQRGSVYVYEALWDPYGALAGISGGHKFLLLLCFIAQLPSGQSFLRVDYQETNNIQAKEDMIANLMYELGHWDGETKLDYDPQALLEKIMTPTYLGRLSCKVLPT